MILYINCCPREESRTNRLASALLEKLGEYEEVFLYNMDLKPLDEESLGRRTELIEKGDYSDRMFDPAKKFAGAETIVIAAPFWDLSFPSMLKVYVENIYVTGIVSRYDDKGRPEGMCSAKTLYYVTTAGGPYDGRYSFDYLKTMAVDFFGIPDVRLIKAEMLDIVGNDPEQIMSEAIRTLQLNSIN